MIGQKIKEIRTALKMSQAVFATKIGIQQGYLSEIEKGKKTPGAQVILSLKRSFPEVQLDFIAGEGEMMSDKQPFNDRKTEIKRNFKVEDGTENYYRAGGPYMIPAIGPLMTPEKIKEGDVLIIDTRISPGEGDFVLIRTQEGPKIEKYQPGSEIFGVVIKLIREHAILRQ
jgi:transcriptional regulator with XRE-family HTH domain